MKIQYILTGIILGLAAGMLWNDAPASAGKGKIITQWEHKVIPTSKYTTSSKSFDKGAGLMGWELVAVDCDATCRAYFKRPTGKNVLVSPGSLD